jgi:hypothetical protein
VAHYEVAGNDALAPGEHSIKIDFAYDGGIGKGGRATISGDGKEVAKGRSEKTTPMRISQKA